MKKQTKVLVAATLLTLGASFSSLAALKNGTWVPSEEGWQYADKEGEFVESQWAMSNGVEFWLNDDGFLGASEWVTDEQGSKYYVQSDGSMTKNAWKYIFAEDEDEADEESWFYFDSKGRMVANKAKDINGATYYFDADGKMLTGWVDTAEKTAATSATAVDKVVFANENGAVVKNAWLNEFKFNATEEELYEAYEGEDEVWYYAGKKGFLERSDKEIDGLTYFFNNETAEMIEGWVVETAKDVYTASDAVEAGDVNVFYATEKIGYAKKDGWKEIDDIWYHFDKLGRVFKAKATGANAVLAMNFEDGEENSVVPADKAVLENVEIKKIDGVKYYFNENGEMIDGLVKLNGKLMYLEGGAQTTGKVTLTDDNENDYTFYFAEKNEDGQTKYAAVNGNYKGYCYSNGQLMTSEESGEYEIVTVEGVGRFIVDYRGKVQKNAKKDYGVGAFEINEEAVDAAKDCLK